MKAFLRVRAELLDLIRSDLGRAHPFARERVGFASARAAVVDGGIALFGTGYDPVSDGDYIDEPTVGALMGPDALRKAMQFAYRTKCSVLHVHMHDHEGTPWFSPYDLSENSKFVPDFFSVAPAMPHGALVLSHDSLAGIVWRSRGATPVPFDEIVEVGSPLRIHKRRLW